MCAGMYTQNEVKKTYSGVFQLARQIGDIRRGPNGVPISHIMSKYTIPIRARAYNDCARDAVLLKTASNRVSGPQNGPILGPSDGVQMVGTGFMGCPCVQCTCTCMSEYTPQNGCHFGP